MANKNTSPKIADPATANAQKMHREIVATASDLMKKWTALARKCLEFKEAQHYKHVINPATKKPFTSFATWVKSVFGTSKSTIFAATRILRELDGLVSDEDLAGMTKENAETLVEAKNAGEEITPELVNAAKKEPARALRVRVISVRPAKNEQPDQEQHVLGPFQVSKSTADAFSRAMDVALEKTAGEKAEETDRAIGFIARQFLASIRTEGEQEVAA